MKEKNMGEFNFKSSICTSRSQSEKLLALGLKKETADMFYSTILENDDIARVCYEDFWNSNKAIDGYIRRHCIPAWSLHRLIEMMPENVTSDDWLGVSFDDVSYYHGEGEGMIGWKYYKVGNIYDCIIECYEWLIKEGYFNKEYLCEK